MIETPGAKIRENFGKSNRPVMAVGHHVNPHGISHSVTHIYTYTVLQPQ